MCLHALPQEHQHSIGKVLADITTPNALLLMSALPPHSDMGFHFGLSQGQIEDMMSPHFVLKHAENHADTGWYWLRKAK